MDKKWLLAQVNLAKHVILHYLKKLMPWPAKKGIAAFEANYLEEGLARYSVKHRKLAPKAGNCTGCAQCDAACPILASGETKSFLGPMRFVASGLRGGPLVEDIASSVDVLMSESCLSCNACERACPEDIPILELARFTQDQIVEIGRSR